MFRTTTLVGISLSVSLLWCGCSPKGEPAKNAAQYEVKGNFTKVTGKVTLNGKPLEDPMGHLKFELIAKDKLDAYTNKDPNAVALGGALVTKDGTYAVRTNKDGDGVLPGDYLVRFTYAHFSGVTSKNEDEGSGGPSEMMAEGGMPPIVKAFNKKYWDPANFVPLTVGDQPMTKDFDLTVDAPAQ